jgi:hypothetical protein
VLPVSRLNLTAVAETARRATPRDVLGCASRTGWRCDGTRRHELTRAALSRFAAKVPAVMR